VQGLTYIFPKGAKLLGVFSDGSAAQTWAWIKQGRQTTFKHSSIQRSMEALK